MCRLTAKLIAIVALSLLLQGCVGVMFPGARTDALKSSTVGEKRSLGAVHAANPETQLTAVSLRERWGEPASIAPGASSSDGELWTYTFGPVWYGIIPCVVLPIPLALPLGKEKAIFHVRDGDVISADLVKCDLVGGVCASLVGPDGRPWAGVGWQKTP
jgi:hypothetical protein